MAAAANSNLKKVSLELGGKSPQLIFESANLDEGEPARASVLCAERGVLTV